MKFLRPELVADRSVPESVGGWMFDQAIWRCGQHAGCNIDPRFCIAPTRRQSSRAFPKGADSAHCVLQPTWQYIANRVWLPLHLSFYWEMRRKRWNSINRISRVPQFFGRRYRGGSLHGVFLQGLRSGLRKSYQSDGEEDGSTTLIWHFQRQP